MKKLLVIAIILLTGMGVSINNTKKVNEKWGENGIANRIDTSLSEESKERLEKNQQEIEKIINDEKKAEEIVEENNKQEQKEETPQVQSNDNSNANKKQENKVSTNNAKKSESTPKQETPKESVAEVKQETPKESVVQETPKQVEQQKQNIPKQEEKIYCVDGGKTHIAGDGANEHGYYKTWDEAFSAYEKYTEGWESSHFKINQCFCGLYYFSVTK